MPQVARVVLVLVASLLWGCGGRGGEQDAGAPEPERQPLVRFDGYVYVEPNATDFVIVERVRQQLLTVFTGLRRSRVTVTKREVPGVDTGALEREVVTVVDAARDERRAALRVRYRYLTRADVARGGGGQELPLAVLHRVRGVDAARVVRECTASDPGDRHAESAISLDFDPTLDACKAAIQAEQAAIDAARAKLAPGEGEQIPVEEAERLYIPVQVVLEAPPAGAPLGALPRFEPLRAPPGGSAAAAAPEPPPEVDPRLKPAEVIVDPDMERPAQAEARPQGDPGPAPGGGPAPGPAPGEPREPSVSVVAPPAPAQPPPPKPEEHLGERFESVFDQLFQFKFIAVWGSLLLVIPVLLGESRKKKKPAD